MWDKDNMQTPHPHNTCRHFDRCAPNIYFRRMVWSAQSHSKRFHICFR